MTTDDEAPVETPALRRKVFGRRTGHKLRARQADILDSGLARLAVPLPAPGEILDPRDLFPRAVDEVWFEIGFGGGEHLAAQAEAHPHVGIIGAEPFVNGMASLLRHVEERQLDNVRVLADDARLLLAALPEASLSRAFLLFPDPWPKSRHHKRRFVQQETLDLLARALKPGAEFRVASDIMGYIEWTLAQVGLHSAFEWMAEGPADWRARTEDWPPTRYEAKAIAAGRKPAYLRFRRR
ncbi:tRNA (guanine(46)-N(7))-methyltransferase TrmB [Zavarzinia aquatilis]|uniref:tRNA (guanine-N(7)-)-methyltransferase n=1 Tax=Zavarzinia aquatilis TaxID=2211142 RepID=A0A317EEF9_9PROT|nr:tRNA (guanine(46)-N(7))-methyltransferase TrmB [Zavarzinia aquatilis]PWR24500.1 tRNA (guanosine(46)-N7)-methyltransferase TrmB [Zavarzinia aquatilis]